jgi:hypothetical protein
MAVMTGTGGTAKWRVTCTGVVRHSWSSQPAGGSGGSASDGSGEDFAAGETGVPGDAGVPGDVADAGADGDADDADDDR